MSALNNWISTHVFNAYALFRWTDDMPIDERTSVLARSESASELLTTRGASLAHESGFFRLGQTFLSREDVRRGSAAVRELLARGNIKRQGRAEEVLFTFATAPHLTRPIGQRMILHYFAHDVLFERPEPLRKAILDYVHKSLIPDDVRRRSIGHYANLASLRHDIAKALQAQECRTPSRDLVDVALSVGSSLIASAELLQRLTLSTVGFTGAALEWMLLQHRKQSADMEAEAVEDRVREIVRLSSPACRLTREVAIPFSAWGRNFPAGHEFLINIRAANRDPAAWEDPDDFIPSRWDGDSQARRNDLSFGKGARSCPAQQAALDALGDFQSQLDKHYRVSFYPAPFSRPLVGTLLAPPLGLVDMRRRS